jgi:hypothetical protein
MKTFQPLLGTDVHYVAPGSADGRYPRTCRAAKIVEVTGEGTFLIVFNPQGHHFPGVVNQDDTDEPSGFTWHYPELCPHGQ